jgi:hypothetical protein
MRLGYGWVNGLVMPLPDEIPAVERGFQLYKELRHFKKVARQLNAEGFRGKKGRLFNGNGVRGMITDTIYIGKYRRNHTFSKNGKHGKKAESEWIGLDVPPIISKELWHECQEVLLNRKPTKDRGRAPKYLFTGLVWCTCGHKMYVPTGALHRYECPKCHTKLSRTELDTCFLEKLRSIFCSSDFIEERFNDAHAVTTRLTTKINSIRLKETETKKEMDKLYKLYIDGNISGAGFKERNTPLEASMSSLNQERCEAEIELESGRSPQIGVQEVVDGAEAFVTHWSKSSFEEKQGLAEQLLDKIVVAKDKIEFFFATHEGGGAMTKRLRSLMATQPFRHMPIICDRVVETPKLTLREAHGPYLTDKIRRGLSARTIHSGLCSEKGFTGDYSTVRTQVKQLRAELRAKGESVDSAWSQFSPQRAYIENGLNTGLKLHEIALGLKERNLPCTEHALKVYISRELQHILVAPEQYARPDSKKAKYVELMLEKFKAGKSSKEIYQELQREVQFEGTYSLVNYYVCSFRRGGSYRSFGAVGAPLPHFRKCDRYKDQILSMLKEGAHPSKIRQKLAEQGLKVSRKALKQYIKDRTTTQADVFTPAEGLQDPSCYSQ